MKITIKIYKFLFKIYKFLFKIYLAKYFNISF